MPQLWVSYIKFVMGFPTPKVTMIRHLIGRSLAALPVTQHKWIWAVTKKWTLAAAVPSQTVKLLWSAYFVFNPSLSAKREYLELLLSRGDVDFFVKECVAFRNEETLISDLFFWENMTNALRTPGWHFTGDVAELEELIHKGRILSSSETLLMLSFGLFLVGQGRIVEGRGCISQFLQDSPEVESFLTAFAAAVEVENQLVDSFVLESNASTVDDETYNASVESIFGSRDVLSPLRRLIREFPLLYNQAQLHQQPLHVFLWLKRIETEKDRAVDSHQSEPVINTFKTAIARCTANFSVVDPAVGELFQSYVKELLRSGDSRSAVEIAEEGAWCTPFSTTSVNMELLGLLAELKVMFCDSKEQVSQYFIKKLTENAPESSRRARGALFSDRQPLEAVRKDPRAWSLAFDLLLSLQKNEEVELFVSKMFESGVISTELAVYVSSRLHQVGDMRMP
ncbi:pre-mRNA-splicing factor SYF1 [Angomonas deanei]|nr:pre-mRNA-splicing factor SYF1 [Angomonas deanei]|eukprot:EPY33621.1 pre-mRNA-splicing factor SYF1 [Angomonas deanei]